MNMFSVILEGVRSTASHNLVRSAERAGQWDERDARQLLYKEHMRSIARLKRVLPFAHPHNRNVIEDEISILTRKAQKLADWEAECIHRAEEC